MEFIERVENVLDKNIEKYCMPIQDGDIISTYVDVSMLKEDFDYNPQMNLKNGIGKFVKWYKEFYRK